MTTFELVGMCQNEILNSISYKNNMYETAFFILLIISIILSVQFLIINIFLFSSNKEPLR